AEANAQLEQNLALAERLGAEVVRLIAPRPSAEVLRYARSRDVTRIVVGKPTHPRWRDIVRGAFLDELVRGSGDLDVSVVTGDPEDAARPSSRPAATADLRPGKHPATFGPYLLGMAIVAVATILARLARPHLELADIVMIYLVGIILVSTRFGYGP